MCAKVAQIVPAEVVNNRMNMNVLHIQGRGEVQGQVEEMLKYNQQRGWKSRGVWTFQKARYGARKILINGLKGRIKMSQKEIKKK